MQISVLHDVDGDPIYWIRLSRPSSVGVLNALKPGEIGIVYGREIYDEYNYFVGARSQYLYYDAICGDEPYSILFEVANHLRSADLKRINSFLHKGIVSASSELWRELRHGDWIEGISRLSEADLGRLVAADFVNSRKKPEGVRVLADVIRSECARNLPPGDLIFTIHYEPTYKDVILLSKALRLRNRKVLLLEFEGRQSFVRESPLVKIVRPRNYISPAEMIGAASEFLSIPQDRVERTFQAWKLATDDWRRAAVVRGEITTDIATKFLTVLRRDEGVDQDLGAVAIPSQAAAPIRFAPEDGKIGLLHNRENVAANPRVLGSARTCLGAVEDLRSYAGFSNTIPNFDAKLLRVERVLRDIASGDYDDSEVVELGTAVLLLEARVTAAKGQLGDTAFAEAASFVSLLTSFLSQFTIWEEFRFRAFDGAPVSVAPAHEVLERLRLDPAVLTEEASVRVREYISVTDRTDLATEPGGQGAVLTAENAAAQAAGSVVEFAKREGLSLSHEVKEQATRKGAGVVVEWFFANAPVLARLAETRGLSYLKHLIESLNS